MHPHGLGVPIACLIALASTSVDAQVPTWIEPDTKLVASDGRRNGEFGHAVATDGYTVVVGAPYGTGRANIYKSTDGGEWQTYSETILPRPQFADNFGWAAAVEGRFAVVSGRISDACDIGYGAVWMYQDTSVLGDWSSFSETLICPTINPVYGMYFGSDVAIDGRVLAVGASHDEPNGGASGAVFLFQDTSPSNDWTSYTETKIIPSNGEPDDFFGHSVDIQDTTLVVGAYSTEHSGADCGTAYIFSDVSPSRDWSTVLESIVIPQSPASYDRFGLDVAVDGETVVIGAPGRFLNYHATGAIFVIQDLGGSGYFIPYSETEIGPAAGFDWDRYGTSVSIENGWIAVGAPNSDCPLVLGSGTVTHLWDTSSAQDWSQFDEATVWAFDADGGDDFGYSVSLAYPMVATGAMKDTNQIDEHAGSVYLASIPFAIFQDGFETGNTSAWSSVVP